MDPGLEDVVAAHTVLSDVDGERGRLIVRGVDVETLARTARFEDAARLLWDGFLSHGLSEAAFAARLGRARADAFERLCARSAMMEAAAPVDALRSALTLFPDGESFDDAIALLGAAGVATALIVRAGRGLAPIAPDAEAGHAHDLLRMMRGSAPEEREAEALNRYLVIVADHGLNASTFAARVVASTRAGLASAVIAGLSALKGPLHGGAPGPVLDMLDDIGAPQNAAAWIEAAFARGDRLMGFGHRVYRVRDPRADAVKAAAKLLPSSAGRLQIAEAVERVALSELAQRYPSRSLQTNVEFHTAVLLEALRIPRTAFTCLFATARTAGWIAHACEQIATKRLVRPRSEYVGPLAA